MAVTVAPGYMLSSSLLNPKPGNNALLQVSARKSATPEISKVSLQNRYVTNTILEKQPPVFNTSQLLQLKHSDKLTSHQQLTNSLLVKCQSASGVNQLLVNLQTRAPNLQCSHAEAISSKMVVSHASDLTSKHLVKQSNISERSRIKHVTAEQPADVKSTAVKVVCDDIQLKKRVKKSKNDIHANTMSESNNKRSITAPNKKQLPAIENEFSKPYYKVKEDHRDVQLPPLFVAMGEVKPQHHATDIIAVKVSLYS